MKIDLVIDSADPEHYVQLLAYINGDRELMGRTSATRSTADGQMGGVIELLTVTLGSGGAAATLSHVILQYLRNQRADVKIKVSNHKRVVEVQAERIADVEALLKKVLDDGS